MSSAGARGTDTSGKEGQHMQQMEHKQTHSVNDLPVPHPGSLAPHLPELNPPLHIHYPRRPPSTTATTASTFDGEGALGSTFAMTRAADVNMSKTLTESVVPRSPIYVADPDVRNCLAGGGAGIISAVLVCPLDVLKLRIQSQSTPKGHAPKYKGTFSGVALIGKEEGLKGLFRGLPITCMAYIADRAIWFGCYHRFTDWFHNNYEQNNPNYPSQLTPLLSTICASLICMTAGNPFWVVRARWMVQPSTPLSEINAALNSAATANGTNPGNLKKHAYNPMSMYYKSIPDVFYKMYTQEGIRSFYNGYVPSLFGVLHVAVQFPLYEYMKVKMINLKKKRADEDVLNRIYADENATSVLSSYEILFASAASKMIASITTYPHEVIRTRLQIQQIAGRGCTDSAPLSQKKKYGIIDMFKKILREEGKIGFYKGLSTNLIRTVPASALSLWGFEELRQEMSR